jgi:hypothetical protein
MYIVDGALGTVLFRSEGGIEVWSGETVELEVEVPLAHVRVRLEPDAVGGAIVASRLLWQPSTAAAPADLNLLMVGAGPGLSIRGQTEFLVPLPPVRTQFAVQSGIDRVDPRSNRGALLLGLGEVTPKLGELITLVIPVAPPPPLDR